MFLIDFHLTKYIIVSLAKMKTVALNFLIFIPLICFINLCTVALAGTHRMMFKINGDSLFALFRI